MNRVAVVTGAARGIGLAISKKLIELEWQVAACDILEHELDSTAQELGDDRFFPYILDITDTDKVSLVASRIRDELGSVSGLVNNAGITRDGLLVRMDSTDWELVLKVNLTGTFNMTKAFVRDMMKQREGSIVNISSVVALLGSAGQANYAASKAGLLGFTRSLARELGPRNIRVNAVAPGFIETEMTGSLPQEVRDDYAAKIPMKCMGKPEDVAESVAFLLSDAARYVTGVVLPVDGGLVT